MSGRSINKDPSAIEKEVENIYIWIDILGFSDALEDMGRFHQLMENLQYFQKKFQTLDNNFNKIISDSLLIIIIDPNYLVDTIKKIKEIQNELIIEKQLFLRGGIAIGKHYQDNSSENWYMGSGLARAVKVESRDICWPVIGTNQKYYDELEEYFSLDKRQLHELKNHFKKGYNDKGEALYFIDYIENNFSLYNTFTKKYRKYQNKKNARVQAKYRWLLRYYHYKFGVLENSELELEDKNEIY